jgi:hypothetical protein
VDVAEYCRGIETYLCRKNDGHLIRVVGPSFDLVSKWAEQGVPLKIAFAGIDRCFERYYRKGPRRRPVKIDFCEADVLDVFDEWKRAVGAQPLDRDRAAAEGDPDAVPQVTTPDSRRPSLHAHLERVLLRLSSARARGSLGEAFDALIDRVSVELDAVRGKAGGLRGVARQGLIDRLAMLDAEVLRTARAALDADALSALGREADEDLAAFRAAMPGEAYARARSAAIDRLVRERFGLPTISF